MISRFLRLLRRETAPTGLQGADPPVATSSASDLIAQGHSAQERGDLEAAERWYRAAVAADPHAADAQMNLGNALKERAQLPAAVEAYERALAIDPDHASTHYNLGLVLLDSGDLARVEQHMRTAVHLRPAFPQAWLVLALAQEGQGNLDGAVQSCRRSLDLDPDYVEALLTLAPIYRRQGRHQDATVCFVKALALRPDDADAQLKLGLIYKDHGEIGAAIASFRAALALRPGDALALGDLGNALQEVGEIDEAISNYRQALAIMPGKVAGYGNLLFTLNYHPDLAPEQIYDAYRDFDARFGQPLRSTWRRHDNDRNASRRLRIGYVSPDFNRHPVRHFLEPLLARHDKRAVEVLAYAELEREDEVTARYRSHVDHWIPTRGVSDEALADRICADRVDVLVDLAGHTANNRLGVFARKPAPVSVSWLGYGYTTGLTAIDYILIDAAGAPVGSEHLFAETPWRLATPAYVYRPAEGMGEVGPLPAASRDGQISFGTLTRSVRINHRSIRVWSQILKRVPRARLVVDSRNFLDAGMRARLTEKFGREGIGPERLELGFHTPPWDVLRGIDIGLDCFPHNSGTTLFESLYMGVPIISLAGRPSVGRLGSSILQGIGHPEWIAGSEEDYVDKAVTLAADLAGLAHLRGGLRAEMSASGLMDEPGFARKVEAAYREMFSAWSNGLPQSS